MSPKRMPRGRKPSRNDVSHRPLKGESKIMTTIEKSQSTYSGLGRLRNFVVAFSELVGSNPEEAVLVRVGSSLLKGLVSDDNWLPTEYAEPDPNRYRQYLLHVDPQ